MSIRYQHIQVVGSASNLEFCNMELPSSSCDLIELRADLLGANLPEAISAAKRKGFPILLTSRDQAEGGNKNLSKKDRIQLIEDYKNEVDYVDIELANLNDEDYSVWSELESLEVCKVASFHDFEKTPDLDFLKEKVRAMKSSGADICKMAVMLNCIADIQTCIEVIKAFPDEQISIMGMGELGAASRVILGQAGSVLNYGYLGSEPTAPGQWSAQLLKQALNSSRPLS